MTFTDLIWSESKRAAMHTYRRTCEISLMEWDGTERNGTELTKGENKSQHNEIRYFILKSNWTNVLKSFCFAQNIASLESITINFVVFLPIFKCLKKKIINIKSFSWWPRDFFSLFVSSFMIDLMICFDQLISLSFSLPPFRIV